MAFFTLPASNVMAAGWTQFAFFLSMLAAGQDRCSTTLPQAVKAAITKNEPGYRAIHSSEMASNAVRYHAQHGGDGCIATAKADVNGDGRADYLAALVSRFNPNVRMVAVIRVPDAWAVETIADWPGPPTRIFIRSSGFGDYRRTEALTGDPLGKNEQRFLRCRHSVAVYGDFESRTVASCRDRSGWKHVWIAD